jgi:hypothetical protein
MLKIKKHLACILKMFKKVKFEEKFSYENIYPTTHDAVCYILNLSRQHKNSIFEAPINETI